LIFSEVKKEHAPSLGAEVRRITPKESLTPEEIQLTREGLLKAARFITDFEFGYPEGEKVRNLLGCTAAGANGLSKIIILKDLELTINPDTTFPKNDCTPEERLRQKFIVAVTLVHELAHAVFHARRNILIGVTGKFPPCTCQKPQHPSLHDCFDVKPPEWIKWKTRGITPSIQMQLDQTVEPYFDKLKIPELGKALEVYLFGGSMSLSHRSFVRSRQGLYWNKLCEMDRGIVPSVRSHITGYDLPLYLSTPRRNVTMYLIPMRCMQKQFTKSFWRYEVRCLGREALHVPRVLGKRMENVLWTEGGPEVLSGDSSPTRVADEEGQVGPIRECLLSLGGVDYSRLQL